MGTIVLCKHLKCGMQLHERNKRVRNWKNTPCKAWMKQMVGFRLQKKKKSKSRSMMLRFSYLESCHEIKGSEQFYVSYGKK